MTTHTNIYTAAGTAGPADEKAPLRAKVYALLGTLGILVGAADTFNILTTAQAAGVNQVAGNLGTLVLSAVSLFAGWKTSKQVGNGTFEPPVTEIVEVPAPQPANVVAEGIASIGNAYNDLVSQVQAGAAKVTDALGAVQVLSSALKPGGTGADLIRDFQE